MLSRVRTPEAAAAVERGVGLLRRMQWGAFDPATQPSPEAPDWTEPIGEDHPYYGGLGYGTHGRPDLSNTQVFVQALRDAGVSTDDPAYERALVFLRRVQMDDRVNGMAYAEGSRQGGFIYATVPDAESVDSVPGQSQAGETVETLADGTAATRLRAYGSMTYAGFKSLLYADLPPDDRRVVSALGWIEANFTMDENPGLGQQGRYYGCSAMARALEAWGEREIAGRDWRAELVGAISGLQEADGGMRVVHERWMEGDRDLITAYALIALGAAGR
jgi:squalene-hopene/tetraprenyl-beta-curcumene cyclase